MVNMRRLLLATSLAFLAAVPTLVSMRAAAPQAPQPLRVYIRSGPKSHAPGAHDYVVTFVTPSGETTPSARATITTRDVANPTGPSFNAANDTNNSTGTTAWAVGSSIWYAVTYLTAAGGDWFGPKR